jgi:hypothetical protein
VAKVVVDRPIHREHIIDTGTDSWCVKHGLTQTKRRSTTPAA